MRSIRRLEIRTAESATTRNDAAALTSETRSTPASRQPIHYAACGLAQGTHPAGEQQAREAPREPGLPRGEGRRTRIFAPERGTTAPREVTDGEMQAVLARVGRRPAGADLEDDVYERATVTAIGQTRQGIKEARDRE